MATPPRNAADGLSTREAMALAPDLWARFAFPVASGKPYSLAPHLRALSNAIVRAVRTGGRLVVMMPPRHGKSETCSIATPAWYLDAFPWKQVVLASYSGDLSGTFSRRVKDLVMWPEHSARVRRDASASHRFTLEQGGGVMAAGVGSGLTGRGADLLIIDDPVKDAEAAFSQPQREKAWEWWTMTARTRVEPGGAIIVVGTRWHEDDLIGRIVARDDEEWEVIKLPAISDAGEPLWPDRWSLSALDQVRNAVGPYTWASLYQQEPDVVIGEGLWHPATIERMIRDCPPLVERRDEVPERVVVAVDPPGKETGAECGIMVASRRPTPANGPPSAALLDDRSLRGRPEEWGAEVIRAWQDHDADLIIVEDNQGGQMAASVIRAASERMSLGSAPPIKEFSASKSKYGRAEPVAVLDRQGATVWARRFPELQRQLTGFSLDRPGRHSPDRLDAYVHAIGWVLGVGDTGVVDLASHGIRPNAVPNPASREGQRELQAAYTWRPGLGTRIHEAKDPPLGGKRWA